MNPHLNIEYDIEFGIECGIQSGYSYCFLDAWRWISTEFDVDLLFSWMPEQQKSWIWNQIWIWFWICYWILFTSLESDLPFSCCFLECLNNAQFDIELDIEYVPGFVIESCLQLPILVKPTREKCKTILNLESNLKFCFKTLCLSSLSVIIYTETIN